MYLVAIYGKISNILAEVRQKHPGQNIPMTDNNSPLNFPLADSLVSLRQINFKEHESWMTQQGGSNVQDGVKRILQMVSSDDLWQKVNRTGRQKVNSCLLYTSPSPRD